MTNEEALQKEITMYEAKHFAAWALTPGATIVWQYAGAPHVLQKLSSRDDWHFVMLVSAGVAVFPYCDFGSNVERHEEYEVLVHKIVFVRLADEEEAQAAAPSL